MILEIERPFGEGKNWKVAGNPIKFRGFDTRNLMPPTLGEHKNLYSSNLKSNILRQPNNLFQPQKDEYRCIVTLTINGNKALQFYTNSFTWLNSKETHLICGISKSEVEPFENLLKSVSFYFSKLNTEEEEHKKDIEALNLELSNRNISEVTLINTEVETLLSVKV